MKNVFLDTMFVCLEKNFDELSFQWNNSNNIGTKYFFLDNILPQELCLDIHNSFLSNKNKFLYRQSFREKKRTFAKLDNIDCILSYITYAFQDRKVIDIIEKITRIDSLEADSNLYAGGLSIMGKDDFLNPHIDNSHDSKRQKYRRLNLLYYVTPNWKNSNGGNLELWDDKVKNNITIPSFFNRLVVMNTDKRSWHSVSPVCVDNLRCCVSNYYFSNISPDGTNYYHVTSFNGRPNEYLKRFISIFDNLSRNIFSKTTCFSRGKSLMNKNVNKE